MSERRARHDPPAEIAATRLGGDADVVLAAGGVVRRLVLALLVLDAGVLIAMVAGISLGPMRIPVADTLASLTQGLGLPVEPDARHAVVIQEVRLPRVLVGACVGASLGVAGATMQGVFRNPLAEPGVVGVSSGAAIGAVSVLYLGWTSAGRWVLPAAAFLGAMAAMAIVFAVSWLRRDRSTATILLVGIAISAFLSACISAMIATADTDEDLRSIVFWLQGGLDARTWAHLQMIALPGGAACAVLLMYARDLNILLMGDDAAKASGIEVARARVILLVLASLLTGAAVAVSGVIGFVGLVVPHAIRLVLGPDHRVLLPASAVGGAAFLVLADLIARTAFTPVTLQVGVVTAFVGAPVFLVLVLRSRRKSIA